MRAILIPADSPPQTIEIEAGLDDLQKHVGGQIELLRIGREDVSVWGNEEAKFLQREVEREDGTTEWVEGMTPNPLASMIVFGPDPDEAKRRMEIGFDALRAEGIEVIDATTGDPREPFVAGPVLITGNDPRTGEEADVPDDLVERIERIGNSKIAGLPQTGGGSIEDAILDANPVLSEPGFAEAVRKWNVEQGLTPEGFIPDEEDA